jgi:4a-hydroxytetrahydrobiopterin dehydratase
VIRLKTLKKVAAMELSVKRCKPCEAGTPPLTESDENVYLKMVAWEIDRSGVHTIRKIFTFKNFKESMAFADRIAVLAEQEQHHPVLHISYRKVIVELHTHAALGLSSNDFIMAAKINQIARTGLE